MGKLIKYEWKKQKTSRLIILAALVLGAAVFGWALLFGHDTLAGLTMALMFFVAFLVLLYTGIESVIVLNRDLRTKQSYMLWMVPKPIWEILGAKFISAILQMLFVFALFFTAGCICLAFSVIDIGGVRAIVEGVRKVLQITAEGGVKWADIRVILIFAVYLFLFWMAVIFIGFFSVILARTVLVRSRFAGLLAVILFFVLNVLMEIGLVALYSVPGIQGMAASGGWNIWDIGYFAAVSLLLFGASGWLADRKLSV